MEKKLDKILLDIRRLLPFLREKYRVNSIEIFGSYVRNEQRQGSDLDLLVSYIDVPGLLEFVELKNYLTDKLHVNVDLVMKDALKEQFSRNILEEAVQV